MTPGRTSSALSHADRSSTGFLPLLFSWGGFALLLAALSTTAQHSYVLFHSLVEIFRIVVLFGIAALAWNARGQIDHPFLLVVALAYPASGVLELLHTLTYKGVGVLEADANLPTQLWIAFRGYESLATLIAASGVVGRRLPAVWIASAFMAAGGVLGWAVLTGRFPDCFVEGSGLTAFKITAEYVIVGAFAAALLLLWRRRGDFPSDILPLIVLTLVFDMLAEVAFTQYVGVYGTANLVGHLLLLTSTYFLYRALLLQGIRKPQLLLFQQLNRERDLLARSEAELAGKVAERTAQLTASNRRLEEELIERKRIAQALAESEEMLRLTRSVALNGLVVMDGQGRIVSWNPAAASLFGYPAEEAVGRSLHDLLAPERYREQARAGVTEFGRSGTGPVIGQIKEIVARRRDGTEFPVEVSISAVKIRGAWHAAGTIRDISERKEQQARIARLVRVYQVLSGINSAIVRIHDRQRVLDEACRVAVEVGRFGMAWVGLLDGDGAMLNPVAARGINVRSIARVPVSAGAAGGEGTAGEALACRRAVYCNDLEAAGQAGPLRTEARKQGLRSACALPLVVDGRGIGAIELYAREAGFFDDDEMRLLDELAADISFALQYIEREERLDYLAYYDALTGLPNRSLFLDRLTQFVNGAKATSHHVAAILLDLDDFTRFNEAEGRGVGDEVLKAVAGRLVASVRQPCSLAHLGADTFAVAINGMQQGVETAALVQQRIFDALSLPLRIGAREFRIAVHAGIALYPGDGKDGETLLQSAEAALREAQLSGARSLYSAPEINARRAAELVLERDLRAALDGGQFVVHYQPRVDLSSGEIAGGEALIRWQHPVRGLVSPAEFIPLAERSGLIVPIGAWVIDAVCGQLAAWLAAGVDVVPIAVNLSPIQFAQEGLPAALRAGLEKYGLDAKYLELELTESLVMQNPEAAAETMRALRQSGLRLSLDDFGTGYSSLAYLSRFPFDFVKIDRAFVSDITRDPGDAAIATAVIAMAHRLNLRVVAEGVETEGQLQYLRKHHCDQIQGFYFSRPVAADAFGAMLTGARRLSLDRPAAALPPTLLLVDDEPSVRSALQRALRREGYRMLTAASGEEALELLAVHDVQVIISDQRMPGMLGSEFLGLVKQLHPDTVRIILSGYMDLQVVIEAVNRGAVHKFLTKPWEDELLRAHIRDAFLRYRPEEAVEVAAKTVEAAAGTPSS